jgi:Uma2 family endonuclease
LIFEVSSTETARIDTSRKVYDFLAIASLESYVVIDRSRRALTVYAPTLRPQTYTEGVVEIGLGVALDVAVVFA